ncbi:MAG: hypothetical protein F4226_03165 [Synechococcus sp. SB0678_bin_12]|nr:hypothetical protein [Synechococcus sp. SB0678_bin_12]
MHRDGDAAVIGFTDVVRGDSDAACDAAGDCHLLGAGRAGVGNPEMHVMGTLGRALRMKEAASPSFTDDNPARMLTAASGAAGGGDCSSDSRPPHCPPWPARKA